MGGASSHGASGMSAAAAARRGERWALAGLLTNVGLAGAKLVAGLVGNSYALIADAVESMVDLLGSLVILGGLRISAAPPDADHPYGHGKAEALAAMAVSLLVLAAGVGVCVKAVDAVVSPAQRPEAWTLAVLLAVVAVKGVLSRLVGRAARRTGSTAVEADAWHHLSDAITSLAAAVGIGLAVFAGWPRADGVAAMVGGVVIVVNGVLLARRPLHELMDRAPAGLAEQAARAASEVPGVVRVQKCVARPSGPAVWMDMHVWVAGGMTVRDSHTLAHRVKDAVRQRLPRVADVLVHIEPAAEAPAGAAGRAGSEDVG